MQVPDPTIIEREDLDASVAEVPNADAVFIVWAGDRSAYLAKTSMLRRRLLRIFKAVDSPRRSLNLREVATRVEYWPTASRFESMLLHYALARRYFPEDYLRMVKLRMPAYVKLILANEFPRTQVSSRLSVGRAFITGRSNRERPPNCLKISFWICSRSAAARRIWSRARSIRAASTAR